MDRLRTTKSDILFHLIWISTAPTQTGNDLGAPSFVNFKGWGSWFLFEIVEIPHPCETRKDGAPKNHCPRFLKDCIADRLVRIGIGTAELSQCMICVN